MTSQFVPLFKHAVQIFHAEMLPLKVIGLAQFHRGVVHSCRAMVAQNAPRIVESRLWKIVKREASHRFTVERKRPPYEAGDGLLAQSPHRTP